MTLIVINLFSAIRIQPKTHLDILEKATAKYPIVFRERIKKYAPLLIKISNDLEVDPELSISIAWAESHFNPKAISWAKAKGIMQVKDITLNWMFQKNPNLRVVASKYILIEKQEPEIVFNMVAGVGYIKDLMERLKDKQKAIIAYNEGAYGMFKYSKRNSLNKHRYYIKIKNNLSKIDFRSVASNNF